MLLLFHRLTSYLSCGEWPILWELSGYGNMTQQNTEKKMPYIKSAKVNKFLTIQCAFCEAEQRMSSTAIWWVTSSLGEFIVKLEVCRNQHELRYLKSYRIRFLYYNRT